MTQVFEYELVNAASILVNDMLKLRPGETIVITADTQSDMRVVHATAAAAHTAGAKPMVILLAAPMGVGKAADPMLPIEPLTAALSVADSWVEFNEQWLLYSTPFERTMAVNKKLRYMCLVGMTVDMMVRLIGRVDAELLSVFLKKITEMTQNAKTMRIATPAGNDLSFNLIAERKLSCDDGLADTPGMHFMGGQIAFVPDFESINGMLVFDGTIAPPCGFLKEPVFLKVENGRVVNISGGRQAEELRKWLESFDDPNMYRLAHGCYGFNPGAKLCGNVLEDERIWGSTEWGMGYLSPVDAPPDGIQAKSHMDGICLDSTVWLDGNLVVKDGVVIHPDLKALADKLVGSK
jgi:leucyl aminopeptidase (aminopeptidase T)